MTHVTGPGSPEEPRQDHPAPVDPAEAAAIDAYLRAYGAHYTREALEERLRTAGHGDQAIAEGWARYRTAVWPPQPVASGSATFLSVIAGIALVVFYGGSALLAGFFGLAGAGSGSGQAVVMLLYTVATVVAAIVLGRLLRAHRRSVARIAGLIVAGVIVYLGLSGACIAGFNATGGLFG